MVTVGSLIKKFIFIFLGCVLNADLPSYVGPSTF